MTLIQKLTSYGVSSAPKKTMPGQGPAGGCRTKGNVTQRCRENRARTPERVGRFGSSLDVEYEKKKASIQPRAAATLQQKQTLSQFQSHYHPVIPGPRPADAVVLCEVERFEVIAQSCCVLWHVDPTTFVFSCLEDYNCTKSVPSHPEGE